MKALGLPLLACLALQPGLVAAKDDPDLRGDTETMEALLDKVVRRVSQPSAAPFFGATEAARAYRLQGFGVVFVVPPRALPRSDRAGLAPRGGKVTRLLAPQEGRSPVSPDELAKALAREDALRTSLTVDSAPDTKVRAARERDLAAIEAKVEALSREAERQRAEAERALDAAMQEVRIRLMSPPAGPQGPPAVPAREQGGPILPPPAPPWGFWFESSEGDDPRTPGRVVEDVKAAVTEAIEAAGGGLKSVRSDEYVAVAVDFVPEWVYADDARADRTIVVRAKKRDLVDHDMGKLSTEELQKKVEVQEY